MTLIRLSSGYKGINTNKSSITMKDFTPKQLKEAHERTKKITDYLIREGYAENTDMAGNIIMGMSEQWYEQILND